jgi:phosphoglycerol transferase
MLTIYFVVPVFIYCAWRLWGQEGAKLSRREVVWLSVMALGCSLFMPYYWAMFLVLLAFVAMGHVVNLSLKGVAFCAVVGLAACLGFVLQNVDTFVFRLQEGPNPEAFGRSLWWMVKFGLYLPDMILPKFHMYLPWEQWAGKNYHWKIPEQIQGESQTAYIGIIAVLGLGILVIRGLARASAGKMPDQPALFWFAVVVFCFAVVGGVNYLLGAFGFQFLRASNRYSLFLAAIGLFYLAMLLTRLRSRPVLLAIICAAILPIGIYDQIPKIPEWLRSQRQQATDRFLLDKEFFPEMERRLPDGAMVFQFPVHGFPENGPVHQMGDYEHFRPYLYTKNLRFSYGTVKGRKGSDWQAKLDANKPLEVTTELAAKGFGHVLINRRAYVDQGVGLKNRFESAGMREIMQNKDFFILEIAPKAPPEV